MKKLKYLPFAIVALSCSATARADNMVPERVAQAPLQMVASPPCVLSDLTSLTSESDVSIFMEPSCPDATRSGALRRLWPTLPSADAPTESNFLE